MQKVVIKSSGGYDKLELEEGLVKLPEDDQVLIECRACGVNFADCCVRMGIYRPAKVFAGWPITPGFEVAGIVKAVGPAVHRFSPGDPVLALTLFGGYTSHLTITEEQVFLLPDNLSFVEGASIPTTFMTAYYALFELVHPKPCNNLLIHSAAGGVGSALVQLGKLSGCDVVGVVGGSHKIEAVRALGADAVIDKSSHNLWKEAEELHPHGYHAIFDANGAETLWKGYQHLAPGGKLIVYGFHSMLSKGRGAPNWFKVIWDYFRTPRFNPLNMTTDNHGVLGFNLAYLFEEREIFRRGLTDILEWIEQKKIILPRIKTYPFEEVREAHLALESGETIGKLVLSL